MKDNKLEIGDCLFRWHGSYDSYLKTYQVVRLTPKRAILNEGTQLKNELTKGGYGQEKEMQADIVGDYGHMTLACERLELLYKDQKIRNKAKQVLNNIRIKEISIQECEALIALFPDKTPAPHSLPPLNTLP